jgi:acyl-CoA thioester hydrolase
MEAGRKRVEPSAVTTQHFRYHRRVQFAETDLAGIVHFSWMFRYMEEAEHALWRAAGLTVSSKGSDIGWPRVKATFEFRSPLHFEDEFEVHVRLTGVGTSRLEYEHTIVRGETLIGIGAMTVVAVRYVPGEGMRSIALPPDLVDRLRQVLEAADPHNIRD